MQSSTRIALVIHSLAGGGAERLMSQLANRWSDAGHEVHLVTLSNSATDQYPVNPSVQRHGLDLMHPSRNLIDGIRANWQRVSALRGCLRQIAPEFILSFCDRMNITAITAALPLKVPMWIAEHSDPRRQILGLIWESWRQWSYRQLARQPNCGCVVLTPSIAQHMHARFPRLKIEVIPPAIHLYECINTATQSPASEHGEAHAGHRQVLSLGRHSPEKNLPALLKAWQKLRSEFPAWQLVMAGDGPERAGLVALATELNVQDAVQFPGWISDTRPLLAASQILAVTSHYEGFPVAMLEAMASGVACVSTPCCSIVEELSADGVLQLARSMDATAIASALGQVMRDQCLREQLSARSRETAGQYTWDKIGPKWDAVALRL